MYLIKYWFMLVITVCLTVHGQNQNENFSGYFSNSELFTSEF